MKSINLTILIAFAIFFSTFLVSVTLGDPAPEPELASIFEDEQLIVQGVTEGEGVELNTSHLEERGRRHRGRRHRHRRHGRKTSSRRGKSHRSKKAKAKAISTAGASGVRAIIGGILSGKGTFFFQGGVAGACGTVHQDSDKVVALQQAFYSQSKCGKTVKVTNKANGKSVQCVVADMCPGCPSQHSLDLSQGAFDAIADEATGVIDIDWGFI